MRILITTDWYKPVINGVVTSVLNLSEGLRKRGHEVKILTLSSDRHYYEKEDVIYMGSFGMGCIYPNARVKIPLFHKELKKLIDWKPDIIHSQCEFSTFFVAKKLSEVLNIPIVHTYHTIYEDYPHYFSINQKWGRNITMFLTKKLSEQVTSIIAPTEKIRTLLDGYGVNCEVDVIPSGINLKKYRNMDLDDSDRNGISLGNRDIDGRDFAVDDMDYDNRDVRSVDSNVANFNIADIGIDKEEKQIEKRVVNKIEWRRKLCRKYNIPEEKYILLYVGRLAKEKNIEELLHFQKKAAACGTVLVLVGDGPARKELEEYTKNFGIEDSVYFLGMVAPEEVGKYYRAGDLFVSASTSETQGLTYAEALASGLPLLCRKDECLDTLVTEKENGWQYKDEQSFMDKLQEWIHLDKKEKAKMSYKAEKSIDALSVDVFVDAVEQLYKREKEWWDYAA